jgi:hypothetical protein
MLYLKHFGKELSKEIAAEKAAKLLQLIKVVYKPMTKQEMAEIKERQELIRSKNQNPLGFLP